jgi:hypothetical protein
MGTEGRRDFRVMEEHLTTCIHDTSTDKYVAALNRYRAKLVRPKARRIEYLRLDTSERDMIDGEETTLYLLIKSTKRREARMIRRTQDQHGRIMEDPTERAQNILENLKDIYSSIDVSDMLNSIRPNTEPHYEVYLKEPIAVKELYATLKTRQPNKAPGSHGNSREIYIPLWNTIRDDMLGVVNQIYIHNSMTRRRNMALSLVCPKTRET